jgi:hypothetical protein
LPEHCRNRPARSWFVVGHCCHFVKQRICLATQTTIDLARIERTATTTSPDRPVGNAALAAELKRLPDEEERATTSAAMIR